MALNSVYKSAAAQEIFRSKYNTILSQVPFGRQWVETSYGPTFVLTAGQADKPPIILLHGSCSNSVFWTPEIVQLSETYRVYAVDIIGEAGNSSEFRPEITTNDFALWMREVLTALNLENAIFIGNSLGGWVALKFAIEFPDCVTKLNLIAAAGLAPVLPDFLRSVENAKTADGTVPISDSIIGESSIPKEVLDFMNLISASYNPIQELPLFTDEQLKQLNMPVLFIDGEKDVIIDARHSARRLKELVPSAEIHLLPNCGHVILNSLRYIIPFLQKSSQ